MSDHQENRRSQLPGFIVAHRVADSVAASLTLAFRQIWGQLEAVELEHTLLLGHAFQSHRALRECVPGCTVGVDGERSLYTALRDSSDASAMVREYALRGVPCTGNVVLADSRSCSLLAVTDWTGTFPLYYWHEGEQFILSSHLRPLARAIGAAWDHHAIVQTLRFGYTISGRTPFAGVQRLLPGQVIRFENDAVTLVETSRVWSDPDSKQPMTPALETVAWQHVVDSVSDCIAGVETFTLMMSGGWDSRTLLAAALHHDTPGLECYSHGDVDSRELVIVRTLCSLAGVPLRTEPIDESSLDLVALHAGFARVENAVFPHWHRAGRLLQDAGSNVVLAGVYGEILGGHYGESMVREGFAKMWSVARALLSIPGRRGVDRRSMEQLLAWRPHARPWYLAQDFAWDAAAETEANNADIAAALSRLEHRGVSDPLRLLEAFVSETRGSRYINMQIASCRARMDVALPFAHRDVLLLASRIPTGRKIHNAVNRSMLRRHAPQLLQQPLASTLVPASYPLIAQEASRFARRAVQVVRGASRHSQPRYSWVRFEFLRNGEILRDLLRDLASPLWDREAIDRKIRSLERGEVDTHPMYDQMAKILSVDLMLR